MTEIFRDPVWQFIGVASAVLISFILYYIQKQKKTLSYEIITNSRLLSIKEEFKSNINILYDGEPVSDVHLLEVNILNSGNTPILATDYESNLSLNCGESATILTADMIFVDPPDINPKLIVEKTCIYIEPILLNRGDSIILKIIATQVSQIRFGGRIAGVKNIGKYEARKGNLFYGGASLFLMLLVMLNETKHYVKLGGAEIVLLFLAVGLLIYSDIRDNIRKSNYKKRMKKYNERKDT